MSLRRLPSAGMSNNMSHSGGHSQGGHAFGSNSAVAAAISQFAGTAGGPTMLHPHQQTPAAVPPAWVAAAANNNACRMTEFTTQLMALAQQAGLQLSPAAAAATASFMSLSAQVTPSGTAFMLIWRCSCVRTSCYLRLTEWCGIPKYGKWNSH